MPHISKKTAEIMHDIIEFASDGTWPQLKKRLLEFNYPEDLKKAGKEISEASEMDDLFEDEF